MRIEFGDIIFYSLAGLVVITLIWLKFVEPYLPIWGVWVVWVFLTAFLISKYEGFAKKKDRVSHGRSKAGPAD